MSQTCQFCGRREIPSQQDEPWKQINASAQVDADACCLDCYTARTPSYEPFELPSPSRRPDLFERPVDRALQQLRALCREFELDTPYKLVPGQGDSADVWLCRCVMHPSSAPSLVLVDRGDREPDFYCRHGCPKQAIREVLFPDPEREATAEARAAVLVWSQRYARRRTG